MNTKELLKKERNKKIPLWREPENGTESKKTLNSRLNWSMPSHNIISFSAKKQFWTLTSSRTLKKDSDLHYPARPSPPWVFLLSSHLCPPNSSSTSLCSKWAGRLQKRLQSASDNLCWRRRKESFYQKFNARDWLTLVVSAVANSFTATPTFMMRNFARLLSKSFPQSTRWANSRVSWRIQFVLW